MPNQLIRKIASSKSKKSSSSNKQKGWGKLLRALAIYCFLGFSFLFFYFQMFSPVEEVEVIEISQMVNDLDLSLIEKVSIEEDWLTLTYRNGEERKAKKETNDTFYSLISEMNLNDRIDEVEVEVKDDSTWGFWLALISNLLPIIVMVVFLLVLTGEGKKSAGAIFSFGKSRARLFIQGRSRVTFKDVAGVDEAKDELEEVVDFLKNPQKYSRLGARIPKGVLLVGPSGTGKTLLARAVAGEAQVPFFSIAGSEFMEMLVGVGASRVRDLFSTAKRNHPAIIFIDEIESIGRHRGRGFAGSNGEQEQTLNQILVEMDGFTPRDQVIVIGATNRPDLLDSALTRPGRFDRRIVFQLPDIQGRQGIIELHMRGKPFESNVQVDSLARRTVGFSGADLENMLNEAAIAAAREGKKKISKDHLEEAAMKVKMGPERKRLQNESDRRLTAFHEAGHAIVSHFLERIDPVHRVSIVARGLALGFTMTPPITDRYHMTREMMEEMIVSLMGGRAAEEMVFDQMTAGASSDLERATKLSYDMVSRFGMSSLGPVNWHFDNSENGWSPSYFTNSFDPSNKTKSDIEDQVYLIVKNSLSRAKQILKEHREDLDRVAEELLKKESIDGDEFRALLSDVKK